ncbi:glycosyltransferase family 2 protein [candidate division KSB1 bacterium]|nr:glycosyltransferase family 2 protein [candidate division KSB1 bacterium]NIV71088.1 glycosyltransferase [Phycisphaerae bacterium]NIR72367.1 glycosyltransferase family 2 protein [candidate division KSB1 bacterium]NIS28370.1 glycosyltransferase family 2 protein [candidate division KSB1 bacterium]NIT75251.1 glycosyltransferase family 2 protein [candidate division KSB1 bacterium]
MHKSIAKKATGYNGDNIVSFTVALPVYNEAAILKHLHSLITKACVEAGGSYEVLYINDGSNDGTSEILRKLAKEDSHVSVVGLSRNFGHPAALAAGIEIAAGESVIVMDADLQDDPAVIPELLRIRREKDAEVVYVVRTNRKEPLMMRLLFKVFHSLLQRTATYPVPRDSGSFGLLGARALGEVRKMTERLRYFPGLRAFAGFKQVELKVERGARYDQTSRVGLKGLVRLAGLAFFAETRAPMTIFYWLSGISLLTSLGLVTYALIAKLSGFAVVAWTSTVTSIAFFSSMIMLGQGFLCEYLARVYEEIRHRPIYIVDRLFRARIITETQDDAVESSIEEYVDQRIQI